MYTPGQKYKLTRGIDSVNDFFPNGANLPDEDYSLGRELILREKSSESPSPLEILDILEIGPGKKALQNAKFFREKGANYTSIDTYCDSIHLATSNGENVHNSNWFDINTSEVLGNKQFDSILIENMDPFAINRELNGRKISQKNLLEETLKRLKKDGELIVIRNGEWGYCFDFNIMAYMAARMAGYKVSRTSDPKILDWATATVTKATF